MSKDATTVWRENISKLINFGKLVQPRGMDTYEILGFQSTIHMSKPIVMSEERKLGYKFMAAEAAWILSGDNRVSTISPYSREISRFSDDGETFFGAYGPRIVDQIAYVVKALGNDPNTRQAVMTIWRPNPPNTKDVPCTTHIQWFIRDGQLHCIDTMRSSDIWLGWPYDIFNFTMLSGIIALKLKTIHNIDVDLGTLTLQAGSQHLYHKNLKDAILVMDEKISEPGPTFNPHVFSDADHLVRELWRAARDGTGALSL